MPTYDYKCEVNGQIIEVEHRMSDVVASWGELCLLAQIEQGETPADAPVVRLPTGGNVLRSGVSKSLPPCQTGGGCPGGACGMN